MSHWLNQRTRPATPELVIRVADVFGVHTPAERQALMAAEIYERFTLTEIVQMLDEADGQDLDTSLESAVYELLVGQDRP